jgi:hypothetical protein
MKRVRDRFKTAGYVLVGVTLVAAVTGCPPRPRGLVGPNADSIEAATTIDYPSERLKLLTKIAARDNLTPAEQIYLADAICTPGGFHRDQAAALVVLIDNPVCEPATRRHILERLRTTRLGRDTTTVVEALERYPEGRPPQDQATSRPDATP